MSFTLNGFAGAPGTNVIHLFWDNVEPPDENFQLYRNNSSYRILTGNTTSFNDTNITAGVTY